MDQNDRTSLPVARDIAVDILDLRAKVPGTDMYPYEYRQKVNPDWQPGPDHPRIKAEPLPARRANLAREAVEKVFRKATRARKPDEYEPLPTANPVVQVVGRADSLDLREYRTTRRENAVYENGKMVKPSSAVPLPPEEHAPIGEATSLFLNTVHACFARHLALGIRPECLMWMVLHEVGIAVKQNAETYRHLFTDTAEKKLIDVQVNELDIERLDQVETWAIGIRRLHDELEKQMPPGLTQHLLPPFSTHDVHSRTASMVAMLDAASPYYDYLMRTCCGIPSVRLFGTAQDYDAIVAACGQLAEVFREHLGDYFAHLLPVLKEIADTAAGRKAPDNGFWSSMYNHYSGSGTDDMDGWITAFVNYEFHGGRPSPKGPELYDWRTNLETNRGRWGKGIHRDNIPDHLSSVRFIWNYGKDHGGCADGSFAGRNFRLANAGNGANFDCRLVGGFLAVDDVDGFVTPALSFAVIRGDEIATEVNADGTWTARPEGRDPVTAKQLSVFGDANPDGRSEAYVQPRRG